MKKARRTSGRVGQKQRSRQQSTALALAEKPSAHATIEPSAPGAMGVGTGVRQAMRFMQRRLNSLECTHKDVEESLNFAREVRRDKLASKRDRLRACELTIAAARHGDGSARDLDRAERADMVPENPHVPPSPVATSGHAGEEVEVVRRFEVILRSKKR